MSILILLNHWPKSKLLKRVNYSGRHRYDSQEKSKEWRLHIAFESAFETPKPDASNAKSTRSSS